MVKLIALKRLRHPRGPDGKEYNAGDKFEASERDASAYKLVRAAKDATEKRAVPPKPAAQPVAAPIAPEPETPAPRRMYRRRDMVAGE